jgi:TolB-like protein/class 3 adenylate cyclase
MERRLAAILAADVVGYSRLMEADEEATARTLSTCREIIEGLVASHHGRVFGSAGDSVIAEFASPVEAVRCAVDIQHELEAHNVDLPEDQRMRLRRGVNLGDVMVEGDNLLGDGVNVAARLEALAEPGGISLARSVFDQVKKQLDLGYEYLGEHEVKNIAEPVQVYRVLTEPEAAGKVIGETKRATQSWKRMALAPAVVVLIGVAGAVTWLRPWEPTIEPASVERMAVPQSEKPTIAVLPFTNMSDDPTQEYFADGMAEDITTDLSKISGLFVVARNSSFAYKGQSPDIREVGRELGVRYVVEGSVRKAGGRVRITVQLIDSSSGHHLWAQRYDRELQDIFDLQDEVRAQIVTALQVKLTPDEETRLARRLTASPKAYDLWLRGRQYESFFTKEANLESRRLFERAIKLDPDFAAAYASLGTAYHLAPGLGWRETREEFYETGLRLVEKAVALDGDLPQAYWALARATSRRVTFDGDRAIASLEKAISLDPNYADAHALLASVKINTGRAEEALGHIEQAMRLNPRFPFWYYHEVGKSQFMMTRYEAAVESFEKALQRNPNVPWPRRYLVAAYGHTGRTGDAEWELEELLGQGHEMSLSRSRATINLHDAAYLERYIEGLRKAGVPEE